MHWVQKNSLLRGGVLPVLLVTFGAVADVHAFCAAAGRLKVAVKLVPAAGQDLAGVKVVLDYPENAVEIPGIQNLPEVKARVADVPPTFLSAPNDTDTELIMGIAGTTVLPKGTIFTAEFDRCKGTSVKATDFHCRIPEASTPQGELVDGATCTVEITSDGAVAASDENQKAKSKGGQTE
jgi:hypothetical protein